MSVQHDDDWISPEQYFERELTSEIRHEYLAGQVYAMAGASVEHNLIAGDIFAALHAHLAGKRCTVFMNDMRAHVELGGDDWFYYPDILVNCDPAGQKRFHCDTPTVIFEVLSAATQRTDEREKFLVYQSIPTLKTYALVAQDRREVRIYRRSREWARELLPRDGPAVRLPELDFDLPLEFIYARVEKMRGAT